MPSVESYLAVRRSEQDLEIDLTGHVVRLSGAEVRLSPTEFAVLKQLISHAGINSFI